MFSVFVHAEANGLGDEVHQQIGWAHVPCHAAQGRIFEADVGKSPQIQRDIPTAEELPVREGDEWSALPP